MYILDRGGGADCGGDLLSALDQWAARWGVPYHALAELRQMQGIEPTPPRLDGLSEAAVQSRVRLEASKKGLRLWRNNVGAATDANGNHIRYGLANDSASINKKIKSSDLIGIRPVTITPAHVGTTIGQFVAREIKAEGWAFTGRGTEPAQQNFITLVQALGGDARFANREGTL